MLQPVHFLRSAVVMALASMASVHAAAQSIPSGGAPLVAAADVAVDGSFWGGSPEVATRTIVPVTGQPFAQAARIDVQAPTGNFWSSSVSAPSTLDVAEGDVLLLHVFLRAVETSYETGSVFCQVYVEGPAPDFTKSLSQSITATSEWTEYFLPFEIVEAQPAGSLRVNFGFGAGDRPQILELGGAEVIWYGTSRTLEEMPVTSFQYDGRELDADWRAKARERIEIHRKSEYAIRVVNADGLPVEAAEVRVRMKAHAFDFGSALNAERIVNQSNPDNQTYLEHVLELFSSGTLENDLKWPAWIGEWGSSFNQPQSLEALETLRDAGLRMRGHVLVWPSTRNLPALVNGLIGSASEGEIPEIVLDHIGDVVVSTKDHLLEWDVINEPYDNHDLMDLFGDAVMIDWFNEARLHHPAAALYVNDYGILSGGGLNVAKQDFYEDTIQYLIDGGAPVGGIGLQGHFDSSPTGIPRVWSILERYANAFPELDLKITEFDVDTADEELQAEYTRDFMTIVFSHPAITGFQMWGFWEGAIWRNRTAMYRQDWTEKPNGSVFRNLTRNEWWTDDSRRTDADGRVRGRGFLGDYDIEVKVDGNVVTAGHVLAAGGLTAEVVVDAAVAPEPRITVQPLGTTVAPGEAVTLAFSAAGFPAPAITWFKNGVALDEHGAELEITAATATDEAVYHAEASNGLGTARTRDVRVGVRTTEQRNEILSSISTRGWVATGDQVMIAGFFVGGSGSTDLLIRGIGPRLASLGISDALGDPRLSVHRLGESPALVENDNWDPTLAPLFSQLGAFNLSGDSLSAAVRTTFDPGGYTAVLSGAGGSDGVGIVEVWDIAAGALLELTAISTRGRVGTGDDVLIAGLSISGDVPKKVLIRGIGPGLSQFGVSGALADPYLSLFEFIPGGTRRIAVNDDWRIGQDGDAIAAAAEAVHAFSLAEFGADAGLLIHLEPGQYSVQLSGADGGTGVALIEAYAVP